MDPFGTQRPAKISGAGAEEIAISALSFLGDTPELMQRFLALSGIDAASIRQAAAEPNFLAGVLKFFLAHEPTLLALCAAKDMKPQDVAQAFVHLPGGG